jgi:CAAX protease family protein
MKLSTTITLLAALLFIPLFVTRGWGIFDFWWWLSTNLVVLVMIIAMFDHTWAQAIRKDLSDKILAKIFFGILSAVLLYVVFAVGNIVSRQFFPFAESGIQDVYAFKMGASRYRIAILMLLIIGPGEELFWRGYLQRNFQKRMGQFSGFLMATGFYALVHMGSGNTMLVLAAAVCGLFWGYLYLKYHSMALNVVSHTVWDMTVFLWLPFH